MVFYKFRLMPARRVSWLCCHGDLFRSAFFFFCNEERGKVKAQFPSYGVGDIAKELGKRWEVCPNRPKFEAQAAKDKIRYEQVKKSYINILIIFLVLLQTLKRSMWQLITSSGSHSFVQTNPIPVEQCFLRGYPWWWPAGCFQPFCVGPPCLFITLFMFIHNVIHVYS